MSFKMPEHAGAVWKALYALIRNPYGVAGVMGNLYAESGLIANNLQNSYSKSLGMTDAEYTKAVDTMDYLDFVTDGAGYGIAQWTYSTRKQNLLAFARACRTSVGDLETQTVFLILELNNYSYVLKLLREAGSVKDASDAFLYHFEKPASVLNGTSGSSDKRAAYSEEFYNAFKEVVPDGKTIDFTVLKRGSKGDAVKELQQKLDALGYDLGKDGADGVYGAQTAAVVRTFQTDHGLVADGKAGAFTQCVLNIVSKEHKSMYQVTIAGLTHTEALELVAKYQNAEIVN